MRNIALCRPKYALYDLVSLGIQDRGKTSLATFQKCCQQVCDVHIHGVNQYTEWEWKMKIF